MFMRIPQAILPLQILTLHPAELAIVMEHGWNCRRNVAASDLGSPDRRSDLAGFPVSPPARNLSANAKAIMSAISTLANAPVWDHLIYAYMVENTRIFEVFRRVVHEFLHGEKLGTPTSPATQQWLRTTEELFFRDGAPFSILSVSSSIRSDLRASRRSAYYRMFGMELNHGNDDNSPVPYVRADVANNNFVSIFEELLREIWVGFTNRSATAAARPTDDPKIEEMAAQIQNMLISRRVNGNLAREEFAFVCALSWFHLTISATPLSPVVADLRAAAASAEQRLFTIAQTVNLPAHGLARDYLRIAQPISNVLTAIETGAYSIAGAAPAFYDPNLANSLSPTMNTVITHWSAITGRDLKARKVATV